MLSYIINVRQNNRFLYSGIEPGRPLPSIPHPLIRGNRIQRHTGSGFTWLTFNYNYGSLMPINCHIAALVTIRGDWSLFAFNLSNPSEIEKTKVLQIHHNKKIRTRRIDFYLLENTEILNYVITFGYSWAISHKFNYNRSVYHLSW